MIPGTVVRFRLSSADCLSILDTLEIAGIDTRGMSFASCASRAVAMLLATSRQLNIIPEPDVFQYGNRMAPFGGLQGRKQVAVDRLLEQQTSPAALTSIAPRHTPTAEELEQLDREQERMTREYRERKQAAI